ncbi:hypothetical protein HDU87_006224 [Geranomyces variabilis]|uniref:polynucleotide adenylyltransferase n=1 Tax=Geranomyces variabilis TaxID=109894 RepID=A0AAD5TFV2_9FUNG|nr:hypothetical protein HDU87_006224 [Geranomyces variabilis]
MRGSSKSDSPATPQRKTSFPIAVPKSRPPPKVFNERHSPSKEDGSWSGELAVTPATQSDFIGFEPEPETSADQPVHMPVLARPAPAPASTQNPLHDMAILTPLPIPPWQPQGRKYDQTNLLAMLNAEIDDYVAYLVPTPAEHAMRELTVARVTAAIKSVLPKADVAVFGSFETKLYLPSSDVDIVVLDRSLGTKPSLYPFDKALKMAGIASSTELITGAKVPIIKMKDSLTNYPVDISFNVASGVQAAEIVKTFVNDPVYGEGLRPLLLIMKQFLLQRHLHEVFTGGMGSYTLLTIIASFLKMHPKLQTGQMHARENLGVLLIEFLEFYGMHFNFEEVGIGINMREVWYFPKKTIMPPYRNPFSRPTQWHSLCCMDPQDPRNEIAGGSKSWRQIRNEFSRAANLLTAMLGAGYDLIVQGHTVNVPTLLGSILCVRRGVIEHREEIQKLYDEIGDHLEDYVHGNNAATAPRGTLKRKGHVDSPQPTSKRGGRGSEDFFFVAGDDSEAGNSSDDPQVASVKKEAEARAAKKSIRKIKEPTKVPKRKKRLAVLAEGATDIDAVGRAKGKKKG